MNIIRACQDAVSLLRSVGIDADTNTDNLNPPCAWVAHDRLEMTTFDGGADVHLSVYLAVPALGYETEIVQLQELLTKTLSVFHPDGEVDLAAGLQTSAGVLPAFRFPLIMKAS